jgi:hypothetical protein
MSQQMSKYTTTYGSGFVDIEYRGVKIRIYSLSNGYWATDFKPFRGHGFEFRTDVSRAFCNYIDGVQS